MQGERSAPQHTNTQGGRPVCKQSIMQGGGQQPTNQHKKREVPIPTNRHAWRPAAPGHINLAHPKHCMRAFPGTDPPSCTSQQRPARPPTAWPAARLWQRACGSMQAAAPAAPGPPARARPGGRGTASPPAGCRAAHWVGSECGGKGDGEQQARWTRTVRAHELLAQEACQPSG